MTGKKTSGFVSSISTLSYLSTTKPEVFFLLPHGHRLEERDRAGRAAAEAHLAAAR
jgi:hypothetical protein